MGRIAYGVIRNSSQQKSVAQHVGVQLGPEAKLIAMHVRLEALEHDLAELRLVVARLAGTAIAAKKSRAEYYREYRKRTKS